VKRKKLKHGTGVRHCTIPQKTGKKETLSNKKEKETLSRPKRDEKSAKNQGLDYEMGGFNEKTTSRETAALPRGSALIPGQ